MDYKSIMENVIRFSAEWELKLRMAVLLVIVAGLSSVAGVKDVAEWLSWIGSSIAVIEYLLSTTYALKAHWRTFPLFSINIACGIVLSASVPSERKLLRIGVLLIVIGVLTAITLFLLPVPVLPPLSGPFKDNIGTHSFRIPMTLPTTAQLYQDECKYELTVQCWFPIRPQRHTANLWERINPFSIRKAILWTSGDPDHQVEELFQLMDFTASNSGFPSFLFAHLALAKTHATFIPDMKSFNLQSVHPETPFPVVIYSHGMYSWRQFSTSSFEKLASNGYIVFSVDHKPSAMVARPYQHTKSSVTFDYALPKSIEEGSVQSREYYVGGVDRRAREMIAVIDYVTSKEAASVFHVDTTKINIMGHSFGGGTCAAVASRDDRVKGCALLDSWVYPVSDEDRKRGCKGSCLMVSSELWSFGKYQAPFREDFAKNSGNNRTFVLTALGTDHLNYCDMHMIASPVLLRAPSQCGPVDPLLFSDALNELVMRFFTAACSDEAVTRADFFPAHLTETQKALYFCGIQHTPPTPDASSPSTEDECYLLTQSSEPQVPSTVEIPIDNSSSLVPPLNFGIFDKLETPPPHITPFLCEGLLADEKSLSHCYDDEYYNMTE